MSRRDELFALARATRGFMPDHEGEALAEHARRLGERRGGGTWLEVGAWCGKSTLYLGEAAEATGSLLYSLDHHHGSEENQVGWEHHDPSLVDSTDGRLNTLPHWQRTIAHAHLEDTVVGIVGESTRVARHFDQPLDLVFIDGGHAREVAFADHRAWSPKVVPGGLVMIHDVFPDPRDGGQAPYEVYLDALAHGFVEVGVAGSLRVLSAP